MEIRSLELPLAPTELLLRLEGREDLVWMDSGPQGGWFTWGASATLPPQHASLDAARELLRAEPPPEGFSFAGGLVGYIGYDCGAHFEVMPAPKTPSLLPLLGLRRFEAALHWGPQRGWSLVGDSEHVQRMEADLSAVSCLEVPEESASARLLRADPPEHFLQGVEEVLEGIREGELYQVNLSRSVDLWSSESPARIYQRLRRLSPAPYGAFLAQPGGAILSNSPELFWRLRSGKITSLPIKGTCPPGDSPEEQRQLSAALEASEKERSELTMIVDLMRSDLARVSEPRSLHTSRREVHALPTLQHAWQRVEAQLRPDLDALDLLAATFPPGSVTGAPKVKAMEWIHRLEPRSRGAYTGAIGYFADGGDACLSVAIRIAQLRGQRARVHAGSGLVLDSSPDSELRESELKMVALRRAFLREEGV